MSRIIETPINAVLGTATGAALLGAINQDTILSVGGIVMTAGGFALKLYMDYRSKKRDADKADIAAWQEQVSPEVVKRAEFEGENRFLRRRVADLEAQNTAMQDKVSILAGSQKSVVAAVNKQQTRVKDAVKRVNAVEQAMGSSSNLELPTSEPSTAVDIPNIG